MRAASLCYTLSRDRVDAALEWVDFREGRRISRFEVPYSPNPGIVPRLDLALLSYRQESPEGASEWLDVHRLSDGALHAHVPMDCRAHFNIKPNWSCFVPGPREGLVYAYKARTLGDHHAIDYICGFDAASMQFLPWEVRVPGCVAGWSAVGGPAHVQMLFVADGVESGRLPLHDLDQTLCFWLGPEEGFGPTLSLGPRPRSHTALGHARALLSAADAPLSVVVSDDGGLHLIDPKEFRLLERRRVELPEGFAMSNFAAAIDRAGRFLILGLARHEARHRGWTERVLVYDVAAGKVEAVWDVERPLVHFAMSESGDLLVGAVGDHPRLVAFDPCSGRALASHETIGHPQYVMLAD